MRRASEKAKIKKPDIIVRVSPRDRTKATVRVGPVVMRAALGRSGRTVMKREGDGATPIAAMTLLSGFVRRDRFRAPISPLPLKSIVGGMLWCDAPGHAAYNRPVRAPFAANHEDLLRADHLYDVCLVMDWNMSQRRRGCGSAIFFHLAKSGYAPTEGCIAVSPTDMRRLLPLLHKGRVVRVI
ncbi:L,D-transpeptidase family protein [Agrobacterium sp. a22-2]|uniref:L,D-transpeptidase family protein n=1 Tax=Agrobacterium sp. a22-2 TaxID=2283840 RepID=UPI001446C893|nr:L,D-transpeptidase family protein [Agrobacterium sp. a22-2]NKN36906.1 L,D-transpeptidase family protein [Agrobacterium sp. a22-2]